MNINNQTMLFEDLSDEEARDLQMTCEWIVLAGKIDGNARRWFEIWRKGCGLSEDQAMLMISTAFPQRALMSLVLRKSPRVTR